MNNVILRAICLTASICLAGPVLAAAEKDSPPQAAAVADQIAALQSGCAGSEAARAERHAASPLYDRLGGYDRILAVTRDVIRRHMVNEPIKHLFDGVDTAQVAVHVAQFLAAGTGGQVTYTGRSLQESHAAMHLTDADFLAAGGDVAAAMKNAGYGQDEIDEVLCLFVALKDQVVLE